MSEIVLKTAVIEDMVACAAILNDWIDEVEWMPRLHERPVVEQHYQNVVFQEREITVAKRMDVVAGFCALSQDSYITALYVSSKARKQGVGKALLENAKTQRTAGLKLWTFEANKGAQHFYRREGFLEVRRTKGDNDEKLPDILFSWTLEGAAA